MNKTEATGNTHTHTHTHTLSLSLSLSRPSGIVILVEKQTYIYKVQLTLD